MFGVNKNGIKVIDGVINEFQNTIVKLKQGIALCDNQHLKNQAEIDELNQANSDLTASKNKAEKFVENLSKLIPS